MIEQTTEKTAIPAQAEAEKSEAQLAEDLPAGATPGASSDGDEGIADRPDSDRVVAEEGHPNFLPGQVGEPGFS